MMVMFVGRCFQALHQKGSLVKVICYIIMLRDAVGHITWVVL